MDRVERLRCQRERCRVRRERETEEQRQDRLARRTQTPHEHLPRMTAEFQTTPTRSSSHVSTPLTHIHIKHCFQLLYTDLTVSDDL